MGEPLPSLRAIWSLAATLLIGFGCAHRARDSLSADRCMQDPRTPSAPSDAALAAALEAPHVLAGRVRWTGSASAHYPVGVRNYRYAIVEVNEFLRGDPWTVSERYRRSFPLLALVSKSDDAEDVPPPSDAELATLTALECNSGESFLFFVALPPNIGLPPSSPRLPGPVERAFGPWQVTIFGLAPVSERERVMTALASRR